MDDGSIKFSSGHNISNLNAIIRFDPETEEESICKIEYDYMESSYTGSTYTPFFRIVVHYMDGSTSNVYPNPSAPRMEVDPPYLCTAYQSTTELPLNTWVHVKWSSDTSKQVKIISFDYGWDGGFLLKNIEIKRRVNLAETIINHK